MNTKASNETVIGELNSLKYLSPFVIKHKNKLIVLNNILIDTDGKLFYTNKRNEVKTVSSLIKRIKNIRTARWLNHLYFIDGYGQIREFKKYVSVKHNLKFT